MADVEWLWKEWIPKGGVSLVVGETGVGKSYLLCYIIACVTGNLPWPDGTYSEKHKVCLLETESMRPEIGRRLARLGVREDDTVVLPYPEDEECGEWYIPKVPDDLDSLVRPYVESGEEWVVVVDSLSGAHAIKENDSDMRRVLAPMAKLSAEYNLPLAVSHHLGKGSGNHGRELSLDRVRGSSTIVQFSRSVLGLEEPIPGRAVRVSCLKSNFAKLSLIHI